MHRLRLALLAAVSLPALYLGFVAILALRSGLTWREMDANHDGATSIGEFFDAADVGRRPVRVGRRACTEIYYLKDGLPAKVVCPAG
jgi:hypothetical protein